MKLSIVIPAYNEADNIVDTMQEVEAIVLLIGAGVGPDYEIIVVDDHSSDNTYEVVRQRGDHRVRSLRLSRRSGSHVALRAGLDIATGEAVICIAADGQDDPGMIKKMVEKWQSGAAIVWALRRSRKHEPFYQKILAAVFYRLLSWFSGFEPRIDLSRADFYLLDRKVVDAVSSCRERNTSLFGLIVWLGFVQDFVEYDRRSRRAGKSKWNFRGRLHLAKDWIIAFSGLPLKLMTYAGFVIAGTGFIYALFVIIHSLLFGSPLLGWSSMMTMILLLGGGQIMMLGILGEYLWRTLDESRNRPAYFIERDTLAVEKQGAGESDERFAS